MIQLYFLTMVALIAEAVVFLSDYYGWKYITLLKTKNYLTGNRRRLIAVGSLYLLLAVSNLLFPVAPGPVLLGEFIPSVALLLFPVFSLGILVVPHAQEDHEQEDKKVSPADFIRLGHSTIELHKRNLGFAVLVIAGVHLLYPQGVLI